MSDEPTREDDEQEDGGGTRVRLFRTPRASQTAGVGCTVVFSLPFIAVGAGVILMAAGVIEVEEASFNVPRWVVGAAGGIFLLAGLGMLFGALRHKWRQGRRARRREMFPDQPWQAEAEWTGEGVRDAPLARAWKWFAGGLVFLLFLLPFNYVGFVKGDVVFAIVSGLLDLGVLAVFGAGVYYLLRGLKYGRSELRFSRYPFFLGEPLEVEFVNRRGFGEFRRLTLTLRCIQEVIEDHRDADGDNHKSIVCYEIHKDSAAFEQGGSYNAGDGALPIVFALPAAGEPTDLSTHPPRYWELEVEADTPGVDFGTSFLLPVYRRP